ncbi:YidC/Oxa1 family membrane protein insertase [Deinobacterium chartae]|uniref:Membrane protein insertase YidC n=1 Tax=Deinobacterium chartae TaxID=521158 RepID=A0A841I3X6_9DEIO|nr:membrane protein insertase YidC [Deinobacterium chartae]MBB6099120.1 YidC/Oxa1 family membrane protein insertase [Deinobacterium chartae]
MKHLLRVLPVLLLASSALAAVDPHWIKNVDVDGDGRQDVIATGNYADIAFNDRGEIIGWYIKTITGTNQITEREGQPVDVKRLQSNNQAVGVPNDLTGPHSALVVPLTGEAVAQPPELTPSPDTQRAEKLTGVFRYTQGGATVTKTVVISPRRYTIDVTVNVEGVNDYTVQFRGFANWQAGGSKATPHVRAATQGQNTVINSGEVPNISYAAIQGNQAANDLALIVRPVDGTRADARLVPGQDATVDLSVSGESHFAIYGGKNDLIRLRLEGDLDQLPGVFAPNIFGQLSLLLVGLLSAIHSFVAGLGIPGAWGVAIILLTLLIRLLIWPLMQTQLRSTAEMQALQPELAKLNEKYKDDPSKRAEATMALYREHGVNPAAGCLPLFIQMPVLIVLWRVFSNFEFTSGFLWIYDLSIPDPTYILPILYIAVNVFQTWISTRKTPEMFRQQLFIQVIFVYFALTFPSGVLVYWVFSTLIGIVQQLIINRQIEARMRVSKA